MPVNLDKLKGRETEFNNKYHTNFSYAGFYSKLRTFDRLVAEKTTNTVYTGTLGVVLKDIMIHACGMERISQSGDGNAVDLQAVVKDFEEYLMQPFVKECKSAKEPLYPSPYGGMSEKERIELVEHVINASPKTDVELAEKAYKSGEIRIRDMRELINEMDFTVSVSEPEIKRIATFMLALENVNKSRSFIWKVFHPIRNNAEKREAGEMKTLLNSFGKNVLERAKDLANSEYKTLTVTRESIQNARIEQKSTIAHKDAEEKSNARDNIKVDLDNVQNKEVSMKVDENEIKQPVNVKNV